MLRLLRIFRRTYVNMANPSNSSDDALKYQRYLDERRALIEDKKNSTNPFDRTILSMSGGALGLSLIFIKQVAVNPSFVSSLVLAVSWFGFAASVVTILISFLSSSHAIQQQIDLLGRQYNGTEPDESNPTNQWTILTRHLNWVSLCCFLRGVGFFATFSFLNLPESKENTMEEERRVEVADEPSTRNDEKVTEGYDPTPNPVPPRKPRGGDESNPPSTGEPSK